MEIYIYEFITLKNVNESTPLFTISKFTNVFDIVNCDIPGIYPCRYMQIEVCISSYSNAIVNNKHMI